MTAMNMAALAAIVNGAAVATSTTEVLEVGQQKQVEAARKELYQIEKELGLRSDPVSVKAVPQAVCSRR